MKIAMISEGGFGGINQYTLELKKGLEKEGVSIDSFWIKNRSLAELKSIARKCNGYDVVHIQHEYSLFGKGSRFFREFIEDLRKNTKAKIIITMHSVRNLNERLGLLGFAKKMVFRIMNKLIKRYSDKIIVHTQSAKKILVDQYGFDKNKVEVISMWAPNLRTSAKKRLFEGDKKTLMCWGFIQPHKNYEAAINSMPKLSENICLAIVGSAHPSNSGRDEKYITRLRRLTQNLNLNNRIKIINKFLSNEELDKLVNSADIILLPYKRITASAVFYRSLAFQKPIIASPADFFEELNKNTGFPVISDEENLAKTINEIFKNKKYARTIKANMQKCLKQSDLRLISKKYKKFYLGL